MGIVRRRILTSAAAECRIRVLLHVIIKGYIHCRNGTFQGLENPKNACTAIGDEAQLQGRRLLRRVACNTDAEN